MRPIWPLLVALGTAPGPSDGQSVSAPDEGSGLAARVSELRARVARQQRSDPVAARGGTVAAREVTNAVVTRVLEYAAQDIEHQELGRARAEVDGLERLVQRLERAPDADEAASFARLGYQVSGRSSRPFRIVNGGFVRTDRPGPPEPVFLTGYGVFQRVREDVESLPAVGANIVQIAVGPSELFPGPSPDLVDEGTLRGVTQVLERAARVGVAVDLLLAPHYFPDWQLRSEPQLRKKREGLIQFCIHHPTSRALLRRFVRTLLPAVKDHPALLSISLSNEPENVEEPCEHASRSWRRWLAVRHRSVAGFNRAHRAQIRGFDEVPLPNPMAPPADRALWLDFVQFNQEELAGWHRMLADAVHEIAPRLPVHAKITAARLLGPGEVAAGVDGTRFADLTDVSGNDGVNYYAFSSGEFAQGWQQNAMSHDLQRSIEAAPVFNSENHVINDREARYVPPEHIRTALWQAAVHGQNATTIWVWDRSYDHKHDFWGSILERPEALDAVGRVNIDMNRAARELRQLEDAPVEVEILHGTTPQVWEPRAHATLEALYTALSFTGLKIGFVTERQLERGRGPKTKLLLVPGTVHLSRPALRALVRFRGRLVFVGRGDLLTRDEHDLPVSVRIRGTPLASPDAASWRELWKELLTQLPRWGAVPIVGLREVGGLVPWGVEWRAVRVSGKPGGLLVNVCNYRHEPVTVRLEQAAGGPAVTVTDVLTGNALPRDIVLRSLEPRLLRVQ